VSEAAARSGRRLLPARLRTLVFVFFMTMFMGLVLSGVMTVQAQGLGAGFVPAWLERFARTYLLVVPTVLVVGPIANRLTDAIVSAPGPESATEKGSQ
jgi:hypothetical protein